MSVLDDFRKNDDGQWYHAETGEILIEEKNADLITCLEEIADLANSRATIQSTLDDTQASLDGWEAERREPCPKPIAVALVSVLDAVKRVEKTGYNKFNDYKFATESDIADLVRPAMAKAGIILLQDEGPASITGGNIVKVPYTFTFLHKDGDQWPVQKPFQVTGASMISSKADDKVIAKCATSARKQFLKAEFQISTGDRQEDPDYHDGSGSSSPPPQQETHGTMTVDLPPSQPTEPTMTPVEAHEAVKDFILNCTDPNELTPEAIKARFRTELTIVQNHNKGLYLGLGKRRQARVEALQDVAGEPGTEDDPFAS